MADSIEKIFKIGVSYKDAVKGLADYERQIAATTEREKELKKAIADGSATQAEEMEFQKLKLQHKQLSDEKRNLMKEINNQMKLQKEEEGSLNSLKVKAGELKKQIDSLSEADRNNANIGGKLIQQRREIIEKLKAEEKAYGDTQRNVGNYEEDIRKALGANTKLGQVVTSVTGAIKAEGGVMAAASVSLKAFGTTLKGLLANPAFLAIAGISGAITAFKFWYDYNKGIEEAIRLTREFTGVLPRQQLEEIREEVQAIVNVYDTDYKTVMQSADALVAHFGVTWGEALDVIRKGFVAGANLNGDFLSKVQQNAAAMGQLGISVETFVGYLKQTETGIFSDQGITLISKAGVNLKKMTDTTIKDLQAIGADVDAIQKAVTDGEMDKAIRLVAQALKDADSNGKDYAAVMSDVFGGKAQLNAEKMIESIADMDTDLGNMVETASNYNKMQDELVQSEKELAEQINKTFGFESSWWDIVSTKAKTYWNNTLAWLLGFSDKAEAFFKYIGSALDLIPSTLEAIFTYAAKQGENLGKMFAGIFKGIKELSLDTISDAVSNGLSMISGTKFIRGRMASDLAQLRRGIGSGGVSNPDTPGSRTGTGGGGGTTSTATATGGGGAGGAKGGGSSDRTSQELAEIRKAEELKRKLITDSLEKQRAEINAKYDEQIADAKRKLETEKALTADERKAINEQVTTLEQLKVAEMERVNQQAVAAALKSQATLIAAQIEGGDKSIEIRRKQLEVQKDIELQSIEQSTETEEYKAQMRLAVLAKYNSDVATLEDDAWQQEQERKALQAEIKQLEATDELERLRLQEEEKKRLLDEARQMEGESAEEFRLRQLQLQQDYVAAQQALAAKEVAIATAKWKAIGGALGVASQLLGEFAAENKAFAIASKGLALAEIAINQGTAIAAGIKQAQSVPFPANIAAIATTVSAILTGMLQAVKTVKSAKFATGGYVSGAGSATSDSIPARLSNGESVVNANSTAMFAPLLSAINQLGGGVPINVAQSGTAQIGEDMLARAVARGVASLPNPVVSVVDINTVQRRVDVIETMATL